MKFKGTIIITDPCYIDTKDNKLWDSNEIEIYNGAGLQKFGFTNYIWENTLYGDWSCTTYELKKLSARKKIEDINISDIKKEIGQFCADAGLVGVFLLDEVLNFNPDFNYHTDRLWTTTTIKDFDGEVYYDIVNDEAFIRGIGNIDFITRQTGV